MADYQGIFGSGASTGVQSIGAGTFITVNNTNPLIPVISVTGVAATAHTHAASDVTSGVFAVARLGTGTANNTVYLRGDGAWVGIDGGHITTGTIGTARLGTGTANNTTYLRGDGTWAAVSGGITGFSSQINTAAPNATVNVSQLLVTAGSTNADIVLQAKGTGAHLAQIPDNTATAGSKRGEYAVDWQKTRLNPSGVASGNYSVISGGNNNTASGLRAFIGGGTQNNAWAQDCVVAGGNTNYAQGSYATVSGGQGNWAIAQYSVVIGGSQNYAWNNYSIILGGDNNWSSHDYATIVGGKNARSLTPGTWNYSNHSNWAAGDAQCVDAIYTLRTTGTGPHTITIMGGLVQGVAIPIRSTVTFQITISAREEFTNNIGSWIITGCAASVSGTVTLYNVGVNLIHRSVGNWNVNMVANIGNNTLDLQATGANGNNIQWVGCGRFNYCIMNN